MKKESVSCSPFIVVLLDFPTDGGGSEDSCAGTVESADEELGLALEDLQQAAKSAQASPSILPVNS